jgi:phosphotransacetylase
VLIGDAWRIIELAAGCGLAQGDFEIIQASGEEDCCKLAITAVHSGRAQIIMKGLAHTAVFVRALLDKTQGLALGKQPD